jgi:hypothetical protein
MRWRGARVNRRAGAPRSTPCSIRALQRRRVLQGIVEDGGHYGAQLENGVLVDFRVDVPQDPVVIGAKESKGCDQRARADTSHELELGAVLPLRRADKQPGAEGTIVAAPDIARKIARGKCPAAAGPRSPLLPRASEKSRSILTSGRDLPCAKTDLTTTGLDRRNPGVAAISLCTDGMGAVAARGSLRFSNAVRKAAARVRSHHKRPAPRP